MNCFRILCAACAVMIAMAASAFAGDISKSALKGMGLKGLQKMSANDGLAIRGKGTSAHVWGDSTANFFGGQTSTNHFDASASHYRGGSAAAGGNSVNAGVSIVIGNHSAFIGGVAGGSAWAVAH